MLTEPNMAANPEHNLARWRLLLAILIMAIGISACQGGVQEPPRELPRPVKTITLQSPESLAERRFSGRTKAAEQAWLAFRVGGEIDRLAVDTGDRVAQGDLLARLDQRDFRNQVDELEAARKATQARLAHARAEHSRAKGLVTEQAISRSEYDQAQRRLQEAKAELDSLQARLAHARDRLTYTELRAPFDGAVAKRRFEPYEPVKPQEPVFLLENLERIEVEVGIPEELILYRERIKEIEAHIPALDTDATFAAKLDSVGIDILPQHQTYPVSVIITENDPRLLPGMTAEVIFKADLRAGEGFRLPLSAVFEHEGEPSVWLRRPEQGTVTRQPIETLGFNGDRVVIGAGLKTGDQVVVAGVDYLQEGQKTRRLGEEEQ